MKAPRYYIEQNNKILMADLTAREANNYAHEMLLQEKIKYNEDNSSIELNEGLNLRFEIKEMKSDITVEEFYLGKNSDNKVWMTIK